MNDNRVAALAPLTPLPALTMLNITNSWVRNVAALTELAKVDELWPMAARPIAPGARLSVLVYPSLS